MFSCCYRKKNRKKLKKGKWRKKIVVREFVEIEKNKSHHKSLLSVSLLVCVFFLHAIFSFFCKNSLTLFLHNLFCFTSCSCFISSVMLSNSLEGVEGTGSWIVTRSHVDSEIEQEKLCFG